MRKDNELFMTAIKIDKRNRMARRAYLGASLGLIASVVLAICAVFHG